MFGGCTVEVLHRSRETSVTQDFATFIILNENLRNRLRSSRKLIRRASRESRRSRSVGLRRVERTHKRNSGKRPAAFGSGRLYRCPKRNQRSQRTASLPLRPRAHHADSHPASHLSGP